jgi:cephalosporin hydroxylase
MKMQIDTNARTLTLQPDSAEPRTLPLYTREAFEALSTLWLQVGWELKYSYTFTWMGRPIVQLPEDIVRMQEVIWRVRPDVVVETGVAHGGSLIFYASLLKAMGGGRVIGVDIEIRKENRAAIEAHPLAGMLSLIEGDSASPGVIDRVRSMLRPADRVLVVLDSNHSYAHVRAELKAYAPLVTPGSYIVATDGIMRDLTGVPRGRREWATDNPARAAEDFAREHPEFVLEQPPWPFNASELTTNITYWPCAWLRRS